MNTEKFNGWSNRETWAAMLHINNDEYLQDTALDYARATSLKYDLEDENDKTRAVVFLSNTLRSWLEDDLLTRDNIAGNESLFLMLTDIGSLYRVDYEEMAEAFLYDMKEQVSA
jgi:hypothetical protein